MDSSECSSRLRPEAATDLAASNALDELLASELLAGKDSHLAGLLQEVDEISSSLQLENADRENLNNAVHRTVLYAIRSSLRDRQLCSLALTDDLTELYNRRAFFALASQQLKVGRRTGQGFLLLFADVDNLKQINDRYGHREGDLALIRAARALGKTFRDSDVIARLGGDEFAVLALEASSHDEVAILGRLKESLLTAAGSEDRYDLSLSVGVARFDPKRSLPLEALLAEADRSMYREKNNRSGVLSARA